MFGMDNFAQSFIQVIAKLLDVYSLLILVRALLSWFNPNPYNQLYIMLIRITEPVLAPLRRIIPSSGIDFSPFVAMLLIDVVVKRVLISILSSLMFA